MRQLPEACRHSVHRRAAGERPLQRAARRPDRDSCAGGFFFSSRRRHTRLQGDWSSDVCSSDLLMVLMANRYILPAAFEYQKNVAESVAAVKAAGGKSVEGRRTLDELTKLTDT